MRNGPQLITYADRLAGDLRGLLELLDGPLEGAFTGVHVLPFFVPIDGADAGFDPSDHTAVDPRLGSWDDVAAIASRYDLMADLVCNHVSDRSDTFRSWLEHGAASPYDGMFLTLSSVFPDGAGEAELARIYRPRPGLPFTRVRLADGSTRIAWTTFTANQIDIDVEHATGWAYLESIVDRFVRAGVASVRLDAVGYAVKRAGTSCFMIPETYEFVSRLADTCRAGGMEVLVEIHGHHLAQIEVAGRVDHVYDFALPPLLLDALDRADAGPLRRWLTVRPENSITVLDTHDGIGVIDVGADPSNPERSGLLDPAQLTQLVEGIHRRSGGTSRLATGAAASNLDLYQVNCTYYDALGGDDQKYLAARLVQVLTPGIPQIYYVGLLAGSNDTALLARTAVGRDINRHHYRRAEITETLDRPVVRALLAMLRWRARHPAFNGRFEVVDAPHHELRVRWTTGAVASCALDASIDLATGAFEVVERGGSGHRVVTSAADL